MRWIRRMTMCLTSTAAVLLAAASPAPAAFGFLTTWGSQGSGNSQFQQPLGLATDAAGNVYVADCGLSQVKEFSSTGTFIRKWGSTGSGNGQFSCARDVAIDGSGVYVVDYGNNRVQKFSSTGTYLTKWGTAGSANGQFASPISIAVDASGHVYVGDFGAGTDTSDQRIQRFNTTGTYQATIGTAGSGPGQYGKPLGLATTAAGNLYVSDQTNSRIVKFNSAGVYQTAWHSLDTTNDMIQGLAADASGNVYVTAAQTNRIEEFSSAGASLGQWGSAGSGNLQFQSPGDVAADSSGDVFIADWGNDRIVKYGPGGLAAPIVITGPADAVGATSAQLTGTINPQGTATSYRFQYGPTVTYGSTTPITSAGGGSADVDASADITGLTPNTLYHYRLVAVRSSVVVATGADRTLTTTDSGTAQGCTRAGHTIDGIGVCADTITSSSGVWTATGNVVLDQGASAGNGPLTLNDGLHSISSNASVTVTVLRSPAVTVGTGTLHVDTTPVSDPVSGRNGLARLTISNPATLALGAVPFVPLVTNYLDAGDGGGVIVTGRPSFDLLGPLAGATLPTGSFSLGIHRTGSKPFRILGGSISWESIELGGGWKLGTFSVGYAAGPPEQWTLTGGAEFPFFSSISGLEISGAVSGRKIDAIGVKLKTPGVPLGTTGIILDTFGGSLKGLSGGAGNPLIVSGLVGGGWTKTGLPDPFNWILHIKDVTLSINTSGSGSLTGELDLLDGEGRLAKATASLTIQISPSFYANGTLDAQFNALVVSALLHASAAMNSQHFTGQGNVGGKIFGLTVGSGSGVVSDKGIGVTTQVCYWLFGKHCYNIGAGLTWRNVTGFPPQIDWIGSDVNQYVTVSSVARAGAAVAPRPIHFRVEAGRPFLDIEARGTDARAFELVSPSGVRYQPGQKRRDLYSHSIGKTATAIVVYAPKPGVWELRSRAAKATRYSVEAIRALGTLKTEAIKPRTTRGHRLGRRVKNITLSWRATNMPAEVRATLYRSTSGKTPGTAIRRGLRTSAQLRLSTKVLRRGANYLYLVLDSRGKQFSVVRFPAPVWKR